ncbi:sugar phosphate isomerase/epimerase family protein [Tamlana sp. 2201CG12-4]|uniref:sugar phosphate isomerase/epimerase family protein n=1 Tax=Tamlana sp. 2201CG12-4 TaxID=3112582 RepID=UPI002DBC621C|nr:sugar phosphate isomerase/epimerase family protein [Tamlana sp. 2201CG12-4]MEC3905658.1 sugar phosphate isomerase/epimerase family protein [Tamlana sp. 2201CG12-4]
MKRRDFIIKTSQTSLALSALGVYACKNSKKTDQMMQDVKGDDLNSLFFKISLAQWSLHRALRSGEMDNLDFAAKSRGFGCEGVEYVSGFFKDKAKDMAYLKEMKSRANAEGQQNVLIMIDGEGGLANADNSKRIKAVENHYKWVEAAHFLGCHAIRVNLAGGVDKDDAVKAGVESLTKLSDFAKGSNINVLVENHGGFSSDGEWMTQVFSQIKNENCGTLPDFGNFCIKRGKGECLESYDKYKGMQELLPFAKAVSAKSYDFDTNGDETTIDYHRVMKMVKNVGYKGFVGIEFEGSKVSEDKGIELTRDLLIKVGKQLS